MRTDAWRLSSLAAIALVLGMLATSCGGGRADPIKIAYIDDCHSPLASPATQAGAELPFIQRGSKLRGTWPSTGVTEATIAGRHVQFLLRCESYGDFTTLIGALRQAVENDGADIVVEPNFAGEGLVAKEYAREHPGITFSTTSGEQSTTLERPVPNLFRFAGDTAQAFAGLGAYAYRTLGWRNVVTVGEDNPNGWEEEAGFVAEFCSLGGHVRRSWPSGGLQPGFARVVKKKIPLHGVDGVVFPSDDLDVQLFMTALARRYPHFGKRLLVNMNPNSLRSGSPLRQALRGPLKNRMLGLVGVSPWPSAPTAESQGFHTASAGAFPGQEVDFYSYDAMEPVLEALKQVHGDLSHGERQFQHALGQLTFHAPNGATTLDGRRQAVAPTYLDRVEKGPHGKLVIRQIGVVPKVEQTFGGYFGPLTAPPSRRKPVCRRRTPPAWVSSVPTTR